MSRRIKYKCKKCNWEASVIEAWADLKPKICGNKKCRCGFLKDPTQLAVEHPPSVVVPVMKVEPVKENKKK